MQKRVLNTEKMVKVLAVLVVLFYPALILIDSASHLLMTGVFLTYAAIIIYVTSEIFGDGTVTWLYAIAVPIFLLSYSIIIYKDTSVISDRNVSSIMFIEENYSIIDIDKQALIISYYGKDNKEGYYKNIILFKEDGQLTIQTECYTNWGHQDKVKCINIIKEK